MTGQPETMTGTVCELTAAELDCRLRADAPTVRDLRKAVQDPAIAVALADRPTRDLPDAYPTDGKPVR